MVCCHPSNQGGAAQRGNQRMGPDSDPERIVVEGWDSSSRRPQIQSGDVGIAHQQTYDALEMMSSCVDCKRPQATRPAGNGC